MEGQLAERLRKGIHEVSHLWVLGNDMRRHTVTVQHSDTCRANRSYDGLSLEGLRQGNDVMIAPSALLNSP